MLVSLVDITERKQRERELEAIATVSSTLRLAKTLDEMLSRLLDQVLALVEVEAGSIWLYDPSADRIDLATHRGWETDHIITSVKLGEDIPGLVVKYAERFPQRKDRKKDEFKIHCVPVSGAKKATACPFSSSMTRSR